MLPHISIWELDKRPIGSNSVRVKPGQKLSVSFLSNENTNIAQAYKFSVQCDGNYSVSDWICKVTFLSDGTRKSAMFTMSSSDNICTHEYLHQYTGTIDNIEITLQYLGAEDTVVNKVSLFQSIALDERTAAAVENLLPGVKTVDNSYLINTAGTGNQGYFAFDLSVSNRTTLIMHLNIAAYCTEQALCTVSVLVNGLSITPIPYYIWATPEQINSAIIVPLVDIPSGDNVVAVVIQSEATVSIRNGRIQAIIDGKYMSSNGGINPALTAVENIETTYTKDLDSIIITQAFEEYRVKPIILNFHEQFSIALPETLKIIATDDAQLELIAKQRRNDF